MHLAPMQNEFARQGYTAARTYVDHCRQPGAGDLMLFNGQLGMDGTEVALQTTGGHEDG